MKEWLSPYWLGGCIEIRGILAGDARNSAEFVKD